VSLKANALTRTVPPQFKETLNVKTTLHKETGLPQTHNPKTPYIYTRERNLALQQNHAQHHTPFPPTTAQTIVLTVYLP
jgi:hypothetical protein